MYRLELHCHNSEVSACSTCPAEQLIATYRAAGYSGIVSTNHVNLGTYREKEEWPWKEKVAHFMRGFEALRAAAGKDFDVLLGCEINLTPKGWPAYIPNDYLIYGMTEDWLRDAGDVREMTMKDLGACAREAGLLVVHAHPFRCGTVMMQPDLFDGYEVFNGNPRHHSHNALAEEWARMNGKIMTSGSDFHQPADPANGGIATKERIQDNETLLRVLRSGDYQLLRDESLA